MIVFGICSTVNAPEFMSKFSVEERFNQTVNTIKSIKEKINESYIILCDNSPLNVEQKSLLNSLVDKTIFLYDEEILFKEIDPIKYDSGLKSAAEAYQMLNIIEYIKHIDYDLFFKISGRYFLNENFNIEKFNTKKINFREFNYGGRICYSTVLYSFNKEHENIFKNKLLEILPQLKNCSMDIETALNSLKNHENLVNNIEFLGVSGNIAPSKESLIH